MREIKFRAWHIKEKYMHQVSELSWTMGGLKFYGPGVGSGVCSVHKDFEKWAGKPWEEEAILMQFTGLKDKNGKEIYEGDIIGRKGFFSKVIEHNGVNPCFYNVNNPYGEKHTITHCSFDDHDEVIGNIHENPELLKSRTEPKL